jgi:adenosylcobinamide-phosphate synthase
MTETSFELSVTLTFLALLIEALVGYPDRLVRAIGHPVTWVGALIGRLDAGLNRPNGSLRERRIAGLVSLAIIVAIAAVAGWIVERGLLLLPLGIILGALAASTLIAQRSLYEHVAAVATALEHDGLAAGRLAVAKIVGRDPQTLDEGGVARAAIESLAENFSDGVVAPVFWMLLGGLPGAAVYKAVNTADSMIGHRTARHEAFGWAAARLDDLVNLPASRLAALLVVGAAALGGRAGAGMAWRAVVRDAGRHRSPNAGYPEAAFAGALGLALAGPRVYAGITVDDAVVGDGRREATAADIRAALALYRRADALLIALVGILALIARA